MTETYYQTETIYRAATFTYICVCVCVEHDYDWWHIPCYDELLKARKTVNQDGLQKFGQVCLFGLGHKSQRLESFSCSLSISKTIKA